MNDENLELRVAKFIKAEREKVFNAWITPEVIKQWFYPGEMTVPIAEADVKVGGCYRFQMKNSEGEIFTTVGEYQEIIPNEKLVFTWGWEGPDRHETLVTVEFYDRDGGTELILTHQRFADVSSRDHHNQGWEGCLFNLEKYLLQA